MRTFFNDDSENHNPVRFAMQLPYDDLPVYQKDSNITGVSFETHEIEYPNIPNSHKLDQANSFFGGISESTVKFRYFDNNYVSKEQTKVNDKNPQGAMKKFVHRLVDFNPDPIRNKINVALGREVLEGNWTNLKVAEFLNDLMAKYSRHIEF